MGTTLINFTSLVWMFVWACFPTFVISWYAQWSFDHCLHHHLSKITSFFKQWPTWRWLDFVTTFQNNLAVTKQQIVKKYFHQSWNINCPILFNTISFYTEMISISLFLGFHIELNILGTRDISCVLHEIQIWNTNRVVTNSNPIWHNTGWYPPCRNNPKVVFEELPWRGSIINGCWPLLSRSSK